MSVYCYMVYGMFTLHGNSKAGSSHPQCDSVGRLERLKRCRWARSSRPVPECCAEEPLIGMALKITHTNTKKNMFG